MRSLILFFRALCSQRRPHLVQKYTDIVLSGIKVADEGSRAGGEGGKHRSILEQKLRYRFTAVIKVGRHGSSVILQANPRLKKGYALAKRVRRELTRQLQGRGVKISLQSCDK